MGILNVTPDSFSDGGQFLDADRAVEHGLEMAAQGAAILDVGGESTRPGSQPVPPAEQIRRVVPVIGALAERIDIPISIDTHDVEVARAALMAGASILNDITALSDKRMAELAAQQQVPVVLMHMQGTPATMQVEPHYDDVVTEVRDFLLARCDEARSFGIPRERLFIDPGIGFGKTLQHNLLLLRHLGRAGGHRLSRPGRPEPQGASSASSRARRSPPTGSSARRPRWPSVRAAGVSIVRVHDVGEMLDVVKVANAIMRLVAWASCPGAAILWLAVERDSSAHRRSSPRTPVRGP